MKKRARVRGGKHFPLPFGERVRVRGGKQLYPA
jgi:hypothetical protein